MSNIKKTLATPATWHWAITPQQVEEIKQGNRDTINAVYFDNLPKFRKIVGSFCYEHNKRDFAEDCLQQIYIDLPAYNFANLSTFFRSLLVTLRNIVWERVRLVSIEQPISGSKFTYADVLRAQYTDDAEELENDRRILQIIDTQKHLSNANKDYLVAVAYGMPVRRGLYEHLQSYLATL